METWPRYDYNCGSASCNTIQHVATLRGRRDRFLRPNSKHWIALYRAARHTGCNRAYLWCFCHSTARHGRYADIPFLTAELEPGDILYIPEVRQPVWPNKHTHKQTNQCANRKAQSSQCLSTARGQTLQRTAVLPAQRAVSSGSAVLPLTVPRTVTVWQCNRLRCGHTIMSHRTFGTTCGRRSGTSPSTSTSTCSASMTPTAKCVCNALALRSCPPDLEALACLALRSTASRSQLPLEVPKESTQ